MNMDGARAENKKPGNIKDPKNADGCFDELFYFLRANFSFVSFPTSDFMLRLKYFNIKSMRRKFSRAPRIPHMKVYEIFTTFNYLTSFNFSQAFSVLLSISGPITQRWRHASHISFHPRAISWVKAVSLVRKTMRMKRNGKEKPTASLRLRLSVKKFLMFDFDKAFDTRNIS